MNRALVTLLIAAAMSSSSLTQSQSQTSLAADLVILNANVRTLDPDLPQAEAVAIVANRIHALGSSAELRGCIGPRTRVIDASGHLVLPGFNDAHVHFLAGGFQLGSVDLREAKTPEEFVARLRAYAEQPATNRWITGGDWDHESWPGAALPTRNLIDAITSSRPVLITRLDGHMALANTVALQLAGITRETPDPPGGLIVRDPATGDPTGILKDAAMGLVERFIPAPSRAEKLRAARAATQHAARFGVTSVQDMSANDDLGVYQELFAAGELKTRIYAHWPLPRLAEMLPLGARAGFGGPTLRFGGLKAFADGSLGSVTAWFFEPYADHPATLGLATAELLARDTFSRAILAADQAGLQVAIHAIGDRANHEVLQLFEEVVRVNGPRDRRFRIEHAQHLRTQDIPRFARGGVIASMQPYHCADDGRWAGKRIGPERCRTTYAFRSLLDHGATLAFGSDWPVAPLNPLQGIAAAVTRQTLDGKHPTGWIPEQKITVEEAVRAYTRGSAFAEFQDHLKGSLARGTLADLVILDRDLFTIDPSLISQTTVLTTVMDGVVVYER